MTIRSPRKMDWQIFQELAEDEGWRIPKIELHLFAKIWRQSAQVLELDGTFCGIVTAVAYQRSGWIGNLMVSPRFRSRGYGSRLFESALTLLEQQGVETLWLTASELGRPIYEKYGFKIIDNVERRVYSLQNIHEKTDYPDTQNEELLYLRDREVWQEKRQPLLSTLVRQGQVFTLGESVVLLQNDKDMQIIGPWYSHDHCLRTNQCLIDNMLGVADPAKELVIDILISSPLRRLFVESGFKISGRTTLMARGNLTNVDFGPLVSFAGLGSFG